MADSNTNGANLGSGNVAGLMLFLDWVVKQNYAIPAQITPLKSAANRVFQTVEGEGKGDQVDVRSLDVEEYFSRFEVAMRATGKINPDSVRAYRSRFERAVEMYNDYLSTGSKPKLRSRSKLAVRSRIEKQQTAAVATVTSAPAMASTEQFVDATNSSMISYPFPLESGEVANLRLPKNLGRRDAARLGAFINALTFDPQKQLGPGQPDPEPEADPEG